MRIPYSAVACAWLGVVACGSDATPGAYLDVTNIPANAAEIEVVLAGQGQVVTGQHAGGGFASVEDATYYAQRGSTGGLATDGKREMVVLIEPSLTNAKLTTELTPIVLARTIAGDDSTLVAFGTIPGGDQPLTMELKTATVDEYAASLEAAAPIAADAGGLQASQRETFACKAEQLTGFAWRATDGSEIRVVRPMNDPAGDAGTLPLDLDCDGIAATEGDCDDLASTVHPGAEEMCDGIDSDCGQDPVWADPCTVPSPVNGCTAPVGRAVCDEGIPHESSCTEISTPACPGGTGLLVCTISHVGGAGVTPCSPDVGQVTLPASICPDGLCTVDAPALQSAGWRATVATDANGPYGARATADDNGRFELQLAQVAGAPNGGPLGVVDLLVTPVGAVTPTYVGINLVLGVTTCHAAQGNGPSGTSDMRCDQQ